MNECAANGATCDFCKKISHFERTCRAKSNSRGRQSVGVIQGQDDHYQYDQEDMDENVSQQDTSVEWVNTSPPKQHQS